MSATVAGAFLGFHEGLAAARGMRALRRQREMSPARLAELLGEKPSWVERRERQVVRMRVHDAERLAVALETTPQGLIDAGEKVSAP